MEKIYEHTLLYDFYGELLTEHQRRIYEDVVFNDLSLGEIAEEYGITRQGVHDLVRRCDRSLLEYESRLHLVEKFTEAKKKLKEISELTQKTEAVSAEERMKKIRSLSEQLLQDW